MSPGFSVGAFRLSSKYVSWQSDQDLLEYLSNGVFPPTITIVLFHCPVPIQSQFSQLFCTMTQVIISSALL